MTTTERHDLIVWAAGFFDGEGCIWVGRINESWRLTVHVSQMWREPLDLYIALFGGSVSRDRQHLWRWSASNQIAKNALRELSPFLQLKREQAETAISFQDRRRANRWEPLKTTDELDAADAAKVKELKMPDYLREVA